LQTKFRKFEEAEDSHKEIGDIFIQIAPVMKMYENYINHYDSAVSRFKELQKESPALDSFVRVCITPPKRDREG